MKTKIFSITCLISVIILCRVASAQTLTGSLSVPTGTENLATLGTTDWAHWGLSSSTSFDHKGAGGSKISNYTVLNGEAGQVGSYGNNQVGYTWTGGSPDAAVTNTTTGVYIFGNNKGLQISVPAGVSTSTLLLFIGVYAGTGNLNAHLSDGSAADYNDSSLTSSGSVPGLYTLTYKAASAGQTLTINWTYTGSSGGIDLQAAALTAAATPDFTISAAPTTQNVLVGNIADITITVSPLNGFIGTVNLSASVQIPGVTTMFTPPAVSGGSGSSTLAVTVPAGATPGSYTVTITGTSNTLTHTTAPTLVVNGVPDFSIGVQPSTQTTAQGSNTSYTISIGSINGFSANVSLSLSGQPSNITSTFTPPTITGGSGSSNLGVAVGSTVPVSSYPLVITAVGGGITHMMGATLNVTAPPPPDFTISLQPGSQTVVAGNGTTYTVSVTPIGGFTGIVTLALSGQPSNTISSFTPASISNGSGTSTLSVTVPAGTAPNTYTLTVTGTNNSLVHMASGSLQVNAPSAAGLVGTFVTPVGTQNLTSLGTSDWAHWGLQSSTSFDRKLTGGSQIGNISVINGQAGSVASYDAFPIGYSWSDGTPDTSVTNSTSGIYVSTTGRGFQFTAPADTTVRTLTVFLGVFASQGKLVAHLSDSSASDYVDTSLSNSAFQTGAYTLQYAAGRAGQTLTLTWTLNAGVGANGSGGNIDLQSATLAVGGNLTPNFSLGVQPSTGSAGPGGTANYTVTVSPINGFTGTVALTVSGAPSGSTATFTPPSVPGGSGTSNLSITVPSNAAPASYPLTLSGTSNSLVNTASATLQVTGPPDFTIAIQPLSQNVAAGNSTSYVVVIAPLNGFTGSVSLVANGLPSGITTMFNPGSVSGGSGTVNLTVTVSSTVTPNNYPFTVNGASGALNHSASATLSVLTAGSGAMLTGSIFVAPGTQNLTALGTSDWADWGLSSAASFNHKAGVAQQISNFTTINESAQAVVQTVDVVPNFTWSDGTPTQSNSPSGTAVGLNYSQSLNAGFQFTAPADTTTRLLTVYVCAIAAQGSMTASLSDGSAAQYADLLTNTGGTLCAAYTFVYRANSANQRLTISWIMTQTYDPTPAIELEAATLSIVSPSATFTLTPNTTSQQTVPGNSAPWNLTLAPNAGFGGTATFAANGLPSGASALFSTPSVTGSGATTATIATSAATPPGTYTVNLVASAPGFEQSLPVTLTVFNQAHPYLGAAMSMPSNTSTPFNLTTIGTSDWAHWGLNFSSNFDDKAAGGRQISNLNVVNGQLGQVGEATGALSFSWTDGTPDPAASATLSGAYVTGLNVGLQITVPADTTPRTLTVYLGVLDTQGLLTAHISDSSSPDYVDTSVAGSPYTPGIYQISYKASLPNQSLTVSFTLNTNTYPRCSELSGVHCLVALQSAALTSP